MRSYNFTTPLVIPGRTPWKQRTEGTSGFPHLRLGVISTIFHARANVLVVKEVFTMRVIVESVKGRLHVFLYSRDILSIPGALLDGNILITFCTWICVASLTLDNFWLLWKKQEQGVALRNSNWTRFVKSTHLLLRQSGYQQKWKIPSVY